MFYSHSKHAIDVALFHSPFAVKYFTVNDTISDSRRRRVCSFAHMFLSLCAPVCVCVGFFCAYFEEEEEEKKEGRRRRRFI